MDEKILNTLEETSGITTLANPKKDEAKKISSKKPSKSFFQAWNDYIKNS